MVNILNYTCLLIVLVSIASAAEIGRECQFLSPGAECAQRMWCAATAGHPLPSCQYCQCSTNGNCIVDAETGILECSCDGELGGPLCNTCTDDTDCMYANACSNGTCQLVSCGENYECANGRTCRNQICIPDSCNEDSQCIVPKVCSNHVCQVVYCLGNTQCENNRFCINEICGQVFFSKIVQDVVTEPLIPAVRRNNNIYTPYAAR